ncbi:mechanosensitive ion channel family protein [Haloferula chungangensis]|uniref:Mechanosensitive ion channel family protein n=1 Tax=Haloferula chungangensis TaxID=1048331 RepID=A0ABW2L9J1_9BACT
MAREHDWTGSWDTHWKSGGARIDMVQDGTMVKGEYPTLQGHFTGEVSDNILTAHWVEGNAKGKLTFAISANGQSFTGRFDNGEWWSGRRTGDQRTPHPYDVFLTPDLSWPRETISSFLTAFGFVEFGENDFITAGMNCCLLDEGQREIPITQQIDAVATFYHILDQTTMRIWDLPGENGATLQGDPDEFRVSFSQLGTRETVDVKLVKQDDEWKIVIPPTAELKKKLASLLEARGIATLSHKGHQELSSPRATMRNFFINSQKSTPAAQRALRDAMDLSDIDPVIRDQEAFHLAEYLKAIFSRTSFFVWQEIPDDPDQTSPYVHFKHPRGDISIVPVKTEDNQTKWKFSSDTIHHLSSIYEDIISLPPVMGTIDSSTKPLFIRIRERLQKASPGLIKRDLYLENWKWPGLFLVITLGYLFARLATKVSARILRWRTEKSPTPMSSESQKFFIIPLFMIFLSLSWKTGILALGLPVRLFFGLEIFLKFILIVGSSWAIYNFIDILGGFFLELAQNTKTTLDDILVSLLSSLFKIIVVVGAFIMLAETFHLPYRTVIAGLGIGGLALAIAARDTLANFIGSAVLLADRPFRRGDLVSVGGTSGTISHVGLRSTDIRTDSDSLLVIPNSVLVNEKITNLSARRNRRFETVVEVVRETSLDQLDQFRAGILELMASQPNGDKLDRYAGICEFTDSSIQIKISCFIDAPNLQKEYEIRHDLFLGMLRLAKDLEVELASPIRKLMSTTEPSVPSMPPAAPSPPHPHQPLPVASLV